MLTPQQKKFGQELINKSNSTKAAIAAGVDKKFAKKIGDEWSSNPEIIEYVNKEIDKSADKAKINRDWIINETKKVLATSYKAPDKIAALTLLDKLLSKTEERAENNVAPILQIITEGDLNIL